MRKRIDRHLSKLILAFAVFALGADAQEKVISIGDRNAVFARPKAEVWSALMDSLSDENIHPETMDQLSGVLLFKTEAAWTQQWGGTNQAIAVLTSKRVGRMSSWQAIVLTGNIRCKELDAQKTEVTVVVQYSGYNGFASFMGGASSGWQKLESNGFLEKRFLRGIESRLPDIVTRPGDPKAVDATAGVLAAIRRVDAAFKLGAADEAIMATLLDAQAKVDEFSESYGRVLPKCMEQMKNAVSAFSIARKGERDQSLLQARSSVSLAQQILNAYKDVGIEALPAGPGKIVDPNRDSARVAPPEKPR
jgi:hypothetical protein